MKMFDFFCKKSCRASPRRPPHNIGVAAVVHPPGVLATARPPRRGLAEDGGKIDYRKNQRVCMMIRCSYIIGNRGECESDKEELSGESERLVRWV